MTNSVTPMPNAPAVRAYKAKGMTETLARRIGAGTARTIEAHSPMN